MANDAEVRCAWWSRGGFEPLIPCMPSRNRGRPSTTKPHITSHHTNAVVVTRGVSHGLVQLELLPRCCRPNSHEHAPPPGQCGGGLCHVKTSPRPCVPHLGHPSAMSPQVGGRIHEGVTLEREGSRCVVAGRLLAAEPTVCLLNLTPAGPAIRAIPPSRQDISEGGLRFLVTTQSKIQRRYRVQSAS